MTDFTRFLFNTLLLLILVGAIVWSTRAFVRTEVKRQLAIRDKRAIVDVSYRVVLEDWGPEFTGVGGTLYRWRWTILDGNGQPVYLGNSPTQGDARAASEGWIKAIHTGSPVNVSIDFQAPEIA